LTSQLIPNFNEVSTWKISLFIHLFLFSFFRGRYKTDPNSWWLYCAAFIYYLICLLVQIWSSCSIFIAYSSWGLTYIPPFIWYNNPCPKKKVTIYYRNLCGYLCDFIYLAVLNNHFNPIVLKFSQLEKLLFYDTWKETCHIVMHKYIFYIYSSWMENLKSCISMYCHCL